jgi:ATP-dependent DNA helicase RecG
VAAFAAYVAIKAGYRAVMMAPTEILAQQHYVTCQNILSKFDISVSLMTSSQTKIQDTRNKNTNKSHPSTSLGVKIPNPKKLKSYALKPSEADLVIGTHALLQDKVDLQNIGLVIVDEQHRFGVKQRQALLKIQDTRNKDTNRYQNPPLDKARGKKSKSEKSNDASEANEASYFPHFLSMTATPIPRTLYLALFADLDLSVIKTMPVGRKEIKTRVVDEANRDKAYQFIRKQIKAGRQGFVICPLIEDKSISNSQFPISNEISNSKKSNQTNLFDQDRKSVMAEYAKLSEQIFPDLKIGMLHGRMKSKEKETVMRKFKAGKVDILVSTSVVEVGVDIPNASIMMIEDAERFGLAQLHQFRGRVGRASHQSFCFLFSASQNPLALSRLQAMEQTNDGFKLAELDLSNRGAGDIFGVMQSGDINLKMASLSDRVMIEKASSSAKEIVAEIEKYPILIEKVKEFEAGRHLE